MVEKNKHLYVKRFYIFYRILLPKDDILYSEALVRP